MEFKSVSKNSISTISNYTQSVADGTHLFASWIRFESFHLTINEFRLQILFATQIFQCTRMQFIARAFFLTVMAFEFITLGIFALRFTEWHELQIDLIFDVIVCRCQLFGNECTAIRAKWFVENGYIQLEESGNGWNWVNGFIVD